MFKIIFSSITRNFNPLKLPVVEVDGVTDGAVPVAHQEYIVMTKMEHDLLLAHHDAIMPKVFRSNRFPAPVLPEIPHAPDAWV